jgi:ATP-binding cassette subfamily B protein
VTVSVTQQAVAGLRRAAVDELLELPRSTYSTIDTGSLHDQVVHETNRVETATTALLDEYLPGTILIVGITLVLARMNFTLMLVTLAFAPLIYIASRYLGRTVRDRLKRFHRSYERFSLEIFSMLRSMDLIRTQAAEDTERARQAEAIETLQRDGAARTVASTSYFVTQRTLVAMSGTAVLIAGGIQVIRGAMSLGELIAFYAGFALLRGPLTTMAIRTPTVIEGVQSLDHLYDLLGERQEAAISGGARIEFTGRIELAEVTFAYESSPVLEQISLQLEPGRVVGLVGPNGSGKSTIANLILGFYSPGSGSLMADGRDYSTLDMQELRRAMGVVPQQPLLRSGSVLENIVYGRESIGKEAVHTALGRADASELVAGLPEGLETQIGQDGVFLSGGQRQRLAIARAIVHQPPLLILDEPTNHLDRAAVGSVVANIRNIRPRPAILLITHKDELLAGVDEVIELKEGRIVPSGAAGNTS